MKVLGIFFGTLAIAVAQYPQRSSNPGFRNARTPLTTAASKDKPYLSIPIVLMPDGKIVPKPAQISYQYLPPQNNNGQQQNNQRSPKGRDAPSNYQVVAPPSPYMPQMKQKKTSQIGMSGSGTRRPSGSNIPKNNKNQPQQQYQNAKYMQQQSAQTVPNMHTQNQRNPSNQQQIIANQPNNEAYKQNVMNFINFASHLGAQMVSQQRETQKNQMQSTDVIYGAPEVTKSYETHTYQGPSSAQSQTDNNMYIQSQAQPNSAQHIHQMQQQTVQPTSYNIQQAQNQVMSVPINYQYSQPNARPQVQGNQQQSSAQNQATVFQQNFGTAVQFPGSQNNPVAINSYIQVPQQTLPQNYVVVSSSQESSANTRPLTNGNFDPQSQMMKSIFNTQVQETPSYEVNAQMKHQNFGNQNQDGQTYITSDGHQISFVNTAQPSPVTYSTQQNIQQQIDSQNASPTVQASYGQPGEQKVYFSYQTPQDLSTSYASPPQSHSPVATQSGQQNEQTQYRNIQVQPQSLLTNVQNVYAGQSAGQSNGQQVVYRVQSHAGSQSAEPATYTYANEQPSYAPTGPKQDSSSGGGKLIYATSSAKQIHYSSSGQGYTTSQLKNNEELSSPYVQFPDSSSSYKFDAEDDDDAEYTKQTTSADKKVKDENDEDLEEGDEETSYKVVYIPLDILKNILNNNSVENQRSDKAS